ncbi:phosphopantetheine-binding protein, partial [Gorillibacterium massiliense]|uniref:phosphopantetheine-binding protein n=1 Tax=Gorillibacterium massiliense TaxID=1280390 RepID=UPI000592BE04
QGYWNQSEKTAEAFVRDTLSGIAGGRLYRTGDLARLLADGTVECLGRRDTQVKVRGFRIELGEIEDALLQHPAVGLAAVVATPGPDGQTGLTGFYTAKADASEEREQGQEPQALRAWLGTKLPKYMVPGRIIRLEAMPLTPSGKVDRRQLAGLAEAEAAVQREAVCEAPVTETERIVAAIWSELLNREAVGRNDDFFELGGHSLLTMQVKSRLLAELGVDVSLQTLFSETTVADLAQAIEERLLAGGEREREIEIAPAPERGHYRLSHAQRRLWFLYKLNPDSGSYHVPMHV